MDTLPINASPVAAADTAPRWSARAVEALFELPFNDLVFGPGSVTSSGSWKW
jgi:hypothetical protein